MKRLAFPLLPLLLMTACTKPDPAELSATDRAFDGTMQDGVRVPVASRTVWLGTGGANVPACSGIGQPRGASLPVRWSNSPDGPVKAQVTGEVAICQSEGEWRGIIFPATGQSLDDCGTGRELRRRTEYQGPCRWGWVKASDLRG